MATTSLMRDRFKRGVRVVRNLLKTSSERGIINAAEQDDALYAIGVQSLLFDIIEEGAAKKQPVKQA